MQACPNWIDGRPEPSRSEQWLDVTNPASGAVMARVPLSTAEEVEQAVESAERAFADWGGWPPVERARVMFRFQQVLRDHIDELARLIVEDNGKTLAEPKGSVQRGSRWSSSPPEFRPSGWATC